MQTLSGPTILNLFANLPRLRDSPLDFDGPDGPDDLLIGLGNKPEPKCVVCGGEHGPAPCPAITPSRPNLVRPVVAAPEARPAQRKPFTEDEVLGKTVSQFRVMTVLSRGPRGVVFQGQHASIGTKAVVKVFPEPPTLANGLSQHFHADLKIARQLGHENVANVLDHRPLRDGVHLVISEQLNGRPLSSLETGTRLSVPDALGVLQQLCSALQAAHLRGITHADVRASNVFLVRKGAQENFVKVTDFGTHRLTLPWNEQLMAGGLRPDDCRTVAPEQWEGSPADARTDIYAAAVLGYFLLTGRYPFDGVLAAEIAAAHADRPPPPLNGAGIPAEAAAAILKALSKRPEARFTTAAEFATAVAGTPAAPVQAPASRSVTHFGITRQQVERKTWKVRVGWPAQPEPLELVAEELTKGGTFVRAEKVLPPVFSRVRVAFPMGTGTLEVDADVVQHVTPEQSKSWNMPAGFGLQFVNLNPELKRGLELVRSGDPSAVPPSTPRPFGTPAPFLTPAPFTLPQSERELQERISHWLDKSTATDPYDLLGLPIDADPTDVRSRGRHLVRELDGLKACGLNPAQRELVEKCLELVGTAIKLVGTLETRAAHDATRGNYRGIARCLQAGLPVTKLEELRKSFLADKPQLDSESQLAIMSANSEAATGELKAALARLEQALIQDPLCLPLQQRYWTFKRQLAAKK